MSCTFKEESKPKLEQDISKVINSVIKQVRSDKKIERSKRQEEILNRVRKPINDIIKNYAKDYTLTAKSKREIAQTIVQSIEQIRLDSLDPSGFNENAIINKLEASKKGIVFNDKQDITTNLIEVPLSNLDIGLKGTEFLNELYGSAINVLINSKYEFNNWIINHTLLNRINGKSIDSIEDLNTQLRSLRQELADNIYDYVKDVDTFNKDDFQLYNRNNKYNKKFEKVKERVWKYIAMTPDVLDSTFSKSQHGSQTQQSKLKAFNSFVLLTYFDDYIYSLFKNNLEIANYGTFDSVYTWSEKGKQVNTTWRVNENIDPAKEVSGVIKLIVQTTPKYNFRTGNKSNGYITFNDFQYIIKRIKDIGEDYRSEKINFEDISFFDIKGLSEYSKSIIRKYGTLSNLINQSRLNLQETVPVIFELFSNRNFMDNDLVKPLFIDWTSGDFNNIYSIYKGIFGKDSNESVASISRKYFEQICQTYDSISSVKFIQYYTDDNNNYQIRSMFDLTKDNIKRYLEQNIDTLNSQKTNRFEFLKNKYKILKNFSDTETSNKHLYGIFFNITDDINVSINNDKDFNFFDNKYQILDLDSLLKNKENIKIFDEFIQTLTGLDLSNSELKNALLDEYSQIESDMYKDLLSFASRIYLNSFIKYLNKFETVNESKDFISYSGLDNKIDYTLGEMSVIDFTKDGTVIKNLTNAISTVRGLTSSNTLKDGEGNTQNTAAQSRFLGNYMTQFSFIKPTDPVGNTLLHIHPELIKGVFKAKELMNGTNVKSHLDFTIAESAYSQFIIDYIKQLSQNNSNKQGIFGNGTIGILPCVNSDKPEINRLAVDLLVNVTTYEGKVKRLIDLNEIELRELIRNEFGSIYSKITDKVGSDWNKLLTYSKINKTYEQLLSENFNIFNYKIIDGNLAVDENNNYIRVNPLEQLNNFIREYNQNHRNNPLKFIDQIHYVYSKDSNSLTHNNALYTQLQRFSSSEESIKFWYFNQRNVALNLLKSDFKVDLTQSIINRLNKKPDELSILANKENWIDESGYMIIAKGVDESGKLVKATKNNIDRLQLIQLHPDLAKYNYYDYLISEEWLISTLGTHMAHPAKYKGEDGNIEEALRKKAQNKRNVSNTAQMKEYMVNLIDGIPSKENIAVVRDIHGSQYNPYGYSSVDTKPWDGATFTHPAVIHLENNSLGSDAVGSTKKPFFHFYDYDTATGDTIKTASFGLTNNIVRNSELLQMMEYKMLHNKWIQENPDKNGLDIPLTIDITKDYNNKPMTLSGEIYYKLDGKYYKLNNVINKGQNKYDIIITEVNAYGEPILNEDESIKTITKTDEVINNNWDLFNKILGGYNSMELKDGKLVWSENSTKYLSEYMNKIGIIKHKNPKTQNDVYQPLKIADIHHVVTEGAIKQGAGNINTQNDLKEATTPLNFFKADMMQCGIQLDKEHEAEGANLSLMTQVWNACGLRGYSFDNATKIYNSLIQIADRGTKDIVDSVSKFINGDISNQLYSVINKLIIKGLSESQNDSNNFAATIAKQVIKEVRRGIKVDWNKEILPMSDNSIYAKLISTISVLLTKNGIKMKIPGLLAIISPAFDTIKLYDGKKLSQFNSKQEILDLQENKYDNLPVLTSENRTYQNIELGRTYDVINTLNNTRASVLIRNPKERNLFISHLKKINNFKVVENITVGRNLASYNIKFNTNKGGYSLYDLDSVNRLYSFIDSKEGSFEKFKALFDGINLYYINDSNSFFIDYTKKFLETHKDIEHLDELNLILNNGKTQRLTEIDNQILELTNRSKEKGISRNERYNIISNISKLNKERETIQNQPNSNKITAETFFDLYNKLKLKYQEEYFKSKGVEIILRRIIDQDMRTLSPKYKGERYVRINNEDLAVTQLGEIQNYELGMNKTFAKEFGLNENDQISDITEDPLFFFRKLVKNFTPKVDNDAYFDIELKRLNGNHVYILNKDNIYTAKSTAQANNTVLEEQKINYIKDEDKIWRTDFKGNKLHRLSSDKDKIYLYNGQEIIVTDNPEFYAEHLKYNNLVFSNSTDINYYLQKFSGTNNRTLQKVLNDFNHLKQKEQDLKKINIKRQHILKYNVDDFSYKDIETLAKKNYNIQSLLKESNEIYASFLKSLEIIASRTPAQSLQSVMKMKIVFFDDPNLNSAFVSDAQLWLQGSDLDIDAVNLATFFIDSNGKLPIWSPYAKIDSLYNINKSMDLLPMPNGETITEFEKIVDNKELEQHNKEEIKYFINNGMIKDDKGFRIKRVSELPLEFISHVLHTKYFDLSSDSKTELLESLTPNELDTAINELKNFINKHNNFLDESKVNVDAILQNYQMYNIQSIIEDPINQRQAQSSVDDITSPIKKLTSQLSDSNSEQFELPGNFVTKINDISRNQVGKKGVGISASSLKIFEALTYSTDYILNHGNEEEIKQLIFDKKLYDRYGKLHTYNILTNAYTKRQFGKNLEQITDILKKVDNDRDAALDISAILGLSVDNAKELQLFKLNASDKTLNLYLYGVMIGVPMDILVDTITSPIGKLLLSKMNGNQFTGELGSSTASSVLRRISTSNEFTKGKFNMFDSNGKKINPFEIVNSYLKQFKELENKSNNYIQEILQREDAIEYLDKIKKYVNGFASLEERLYLNKFVDKLYDKLYELDIVNKNKIYYENLVQLASGAEELSKFRQMVKYNQGLPNKPEEILLDAYRIKKSLVGDTLKLEDIDITKFIDDTYLRNLEYSYTKDTFNVIQMIRFSGHFRKYLSLFATLYASNLRIAKFKFIADNIDTVFKQMNATSKKKQIQVIKGLQQYCGDFIINSYLLETNKSFVIPKNFDYFGNSGFVEKSDTIQRIYLGTEEGNATFKRWMDLSVIPRLKQGFLNQNNSIELTSIKNNKFIKSLNTVLYNLNLSHSPSIDYGLGINMMPRTDNERLVFNSIKSEFNKLQSYDFVMADGSKIPLVDLFALYNLITYSNKLGQNSLTAIFEDVLNKGLYKQFSDYGAMFDKERVIPFQNWTDVIYRYAAGNGSIYDTNSTYIYGRLKDSDKKEFLKNNKKLEEINNPKKDTSNQENEYEDLYDIDYESSYDYGEYEDSYDIDYGEESYDPNSNIEFKADNEVLDLNYFVKGFNGNQFGIPTDKNSKPLYDFLRKKYKDMDIFKMDKNDNVQLEDGTNIDIFAIKTRRGTMINTSMLDTIQENKNNPC